MFITQAPHPMRHRRSPFALLSLVVIVGACVNPEARLGWGDSGLCSDGARSTGETDVDCGGPCAPCGAGAHCLADADCESGACDPNTLVCASVECADGEKNGDETDIDCGGGSCAPCALGDDCLVGTDCQDGVCDQICLPPRCGDGVVNGSEACDGDGAGTPGETATCNADCTMAVCGDGKVNAALGETCDDEGESFSCDADCTAAECGDGVVNTTASELCDDGGPSEDCTDTCIPTSCGDGEVNEAAGEQCDDGQMTATCDDDCTFPVCQDGKVNPFVGEVCDDGVETASCDDDCTAVSCGDGNVNQAAGEACDGGGETATCDDDCTPVVCGDGNLNQAAGEQCDDGNTVGGDGCSAGCTFEIRQYFVKLGNLVNLPNNCSATPSRAPYTSCAAGQQWGFSWNDTTPFQVGAVTIELYHGIWCGSNTAKAPTLNGAAAGSFNLVGGSCDCDPLEQVNTWNLSAGGVNAYNEGGVNTFIITAESSCEGLVLNGGWDGGSYARITVTP